jgi:hypothetical protein
MQQPATQQPAKPQIRHLWAWLLLCLLLLVQAIYFSWLLLAPRDFLYGRWYQVMDIDQAILRYAPLNYYKQDFAKTDRNEHIRLFHKITRAIDGDETHRHTQLSTLSYQDPQGKAIDTLMREPEVQHLMDVGKLVDNFKRFSLMSLVVSAALLFFLYRQRSAFPGLKILGTSFAILIGAITLLIFLLGPVKVFYQLHLWLFPPQHQWFFYYQESLMTTFMQAPMLFGYIAAALVALAILIFTLGLIALAYGFGAFHNSSKR